MKKSYARICASAGNTEHRTDVNWRHDAEKHGKWQGVQVEVGEWQHPDHLIRSRQPYITVRLWTGEGTSYETSFRKASAYLPFEDFTVSLIECLKNKEERMLLEQLRSQLDAALQNTGAG